MAIAEGETAYFPLEVSYIIIIIINSITFRFTILLNVLVIKVVKTTPWLRSNSEILLLELQTGTIFSQHPLISFKRD